MKGVMKVKEDMKGVLFIVRGQYRRDKGEKFFNEVSNTYHHIGGYDPSDSSNPEWYMLVESLTFHTLACGSDLEKVIGVARLYIKKYSTQEKFKKMLGRLESKDSPITKRIMEEVYKEYGDTYTSLIEDVVDVAYQEVRDKRKNKIKRIGRKSESDVLPTGVNTQKVLQTPAVKKVNTKRKSCVKKLACE